MRLRATRAINPAKQVGAQQEPVREDGLRRILGKCTVEKDLPHEAHDAGGELAVHFHDASGLRKHRSGLRTALNGATPEGSRIERLARGFRVVLVPQR